MQWLQRQLFGVFGTVRQKFRSLRKKKEINPNTASRKIIPATLTALDISVTGKGENLL